MVILFLIGQKRLRKEENVLDISIFSFFHNGLKCRGGGGGGGGGEREEGACVGETKFHYRREVTYFSLNFVVMNKLSPLHHWPVKAEWNIFSFQSY